MTAILVNYWNLQEQKRHNLAYEQETVRHNMSTENIQSAQVSLGYAQLNEDVRHNKVMEQRVMYQNIADLSKSASQVMPMFIKNKNDSGNSGSGKGTKSMASTEGYAGKYLKEQIGYEGKYQTENVPAVKRKNTATISSEGYSGGQPTLFPNSRGSTLTDLAKSFITTPFGMPMGIGTMVPIF